MADPLSPADMTLDELRPLLGAALPVHAAFDGWSDTALAAAAADVGIPPDRARLVFPGGAAQMIDAWIAAADAQLAAALPAETLAGLKIRARIALLVRTRIEQAAGHREAVRRALSVLALPQNLGLAARTLWRTADVMWRLAGDTATDFNHYSKRLILGGVYSSTLLVWLDDESEGYADTWSFLDRRIEGVMQFEKVKARWREQRQYLPDPARFLGRLRYPAP